MDVESDTVAGSMTEGSPNPASVMIDRQRRRPPWPRRPGRRGDGSSLRLGDQRRISRATSSAASGPPMTNERVISLRYPSTSAPTSTIRRSPPRTPDRSASMRQPALGPARRSSRMPDRRTRGPHGVVERKPELPLGRAGPAALSVSASAASASAAAASMRASSAGSLTLRSSRRSPETATSSLSASAAAHWRC